MPYLKLNGRNVYYEIHGDATESLLFLNGIMMSSASWQPFIESLKSHVSVILVDFFDQGKSDYLDFEYTQDIQVELVESLVGALDLKQVTLLGISYGGEVAMQIASKRPKWLSKLILANTTSYTNPQLKAIGDSWVYAAQSHDGKQFFKSTIPPIYSAGFYEMNLEWLNAREALFVKAFDAKWYDGFIRLVISAETHDARDLVDKIEVPTLIIGADEDLITPVSCQQSLYDAISDARFVVIKSCGHASMYEKPIEFFTAVIGFVVMGHETFKI